MTTADHRPDPDFVARLEGRLTADYRRLERFDVPAARAPGTWLRAAACGVAGLLLGAAGMTTAQLVDAAATRDLLQRQAVTTASVANRRVEVNRRLLEARMRDVEVGVIPGAAIAPLRAQLVEAEQRSALATLNVEEVEASGRATRDDIAAPLVGQRDFVAERLRVELDFVAQRAALLEPAIEGAAVRVDTGVAEPRSLRPLLTERQRLAAETTRIRESLALRETFLAGGIGAGEAGARQRLLLAMARQELAAALLDDVRAEHARTTQRYETGVTPVVAVYASARELLEREADAEMAQIEIDLIVQELAPGQRE